MAFGISRNRLTQNGRSVDYIESIFMGGTFAAPPRIAVIHFTYGASARSSAAWFRDRSNPGSSAHVIVERDGSVIQCVPLNRVSWHAGRSRWRNLVGLNDYAYGIELANWGYLRRSDQGWTSYTGVRIGDPVLAAHRNGNPPPNPAREAIGWERFPDAQVTTAIEIVRRLVADLGVNEVVGHDDISPTRKWDPGPAFDMARFRRRVFGDRAEDGDVRLRVAEPTGLNLRTGPGRHFADIELLADGTILHPLSRDGSWLEVSVLDGTGRARATGWVHGGYVQEA